MGRACARSSQWCYDSNLLPSSLSAGRSCLHSSLPPPGRTRAKRQQAGLQDEARAARRRHWAGWAGPRAAQRGCGLSRAGIQAGPVAPVGANPSSLQSSPLPLGRVAARRRRAGLLGVNRAWPARPAGRVAGSFSRISSHLSSTNKLTVETAFFVFNYRIPRVILVTIVSHCKPELEGMHTGSGIPRSSGCLL